jgi:stage V sporulation protein S
MSEQSVTPSASTHDDEDEVFRVKASASVPNLASAIAYAMYDDKRVVLRTIGAGALNQATKAVIVAQGYVGPRGMTLYTRPSFASLTTATGEVSAISLAVRALRD